MEQECAWRRFLLDVGVGSVLFQMFHAQAPARGAGNGGWRDCAEASSSRGDSASEGVSRFTEIAELLERALASEQAQAAIRSRHQSRGIDVLESVA